MSSEKALNQLVKGAPTAEVKPPRTHPLPHLDSTNDPTLATLPSSPPQIYLNLLILETSLRAQYLHLISRRRLNTFFLLLLALWNVGFTYALFLRPREDGTGLGGSVYWMVETTQKLALITGIVTVLLVYATGQWDRGIRWPRKWLGTTNRGLRGFNLRVVIIRGKLWREMLGHMSFLLPYGLWRGESGGSGDWHLVEHEDGTTVEEDLAPGGDGIMLLLLPKSFSPEFRENWESYRTEYWDKENERRAHMRKKLDIQRRVRAKDQGGWKWWTGAWRFASPHRHGRHHHDLEKHPHPHHPPHHPTARHGSVTASIGGAGRRRTGLVPDADINTLSNPRGSRSRQSSRSSTPHLDVLESTGGPLLSERVRRGSSVSSTASARRKHRSGTTGGGGPGPGLGGIDRRDSAGLSPLTVHSATTAAPVEDEREERRRRRREREAARDRKAARDREENDANSASSAPTTPRTESFDHASIRTIVKAEPGQESMPA
ncbi:Nem1-Spo7 phosphatase regulatory subunit [Rhinocladiella similis]